MRAIQELMGYATGDMTERQAHLSPDTRREAVAVLDRPLAPACDIRATRMEAAANHPSQQRQTVEAAGIEAARA